MAKANLFDFDIAGVDELVKAFDELPNVVQKGVWTGVLKEAAKPVLESAKARVTVEHGHLRDSLSISTKLAHPDMALKVGRLGSAVYVGPSYPKGNHGHLVEFGTGPRYHKSGKYVGQMPAKPFMRPAWDENKDQVLQVIREVIWKKLAGAAKAMRKRAEKGTLSRAARRKFGGE